MNLDINGHFIQYNNFTNMTRQCAGFIHLPDYVSHSVREIKLLRQIYAKFILSMFADVICKATPLPLVP